MSVCYTSAGIPEPCGGFNVYNSYVTDPRYQRYFTIGWTCFLALCFRLTLPSIFRHFWSGRYKERGLWGYFGLVGNEGKRGYKVIQEEEKGELAVAPLVATTEKAVASRKARLYRQLAVRWFAIKSLLLSTTRYTPPLPFPRLITRLFYRHRTSCHPHRPLLPASLGTLLATLLIPILYLSTLLPESQLRANPNRFGFLALASIAPILVLGNKNGVVAWTLGKGWEKVNWLHRWMGRAMILLVLLHFYFWTVQWVPTHQVEEFLGQEKEKRGIGALVALLVLGVSSSLPIRKYSYPLFFISHYVSFVTFLVYVNKHTVYAQGWATYVVVGIWGVDIMGRVASWRWRVVEVEAMEGGMTRIDIGGVEKGWRASQHLQLRLFFVPVSNSIWSTFRSFESHPFTIASAPPSIGILNSSSSTSSPTISLYARACGHHTWTRDLYEYSKTVASHPEILPSDPSSGRSRVRILAMLEGPYGGVDGYDSLESQDGNETVLLTAGGSGMSYVCGILDELVGRRKQTWLAGQKKGKKSGGGRILVVWAVRERGHISWFSDSLRKLIDAASEIPGLRISLQIYITCDPTLTSMATATSSATSSSSSLFVTPDTNVPLPHTQYLYTRPHLSTLVATLVQSTLAPCMSCWPVCKCGEGVECPNDEEKCCGVLGRGEREERLDTVPELKSCCSPSSSGEGKVVKEEKDVDDEKDDITVIGSTRAAGPSCCAPQVSGTQQLLSKSESSSISSITKDGENVVPARSCCAGTGTGCCSGEVEGRAEDDPSGPQKLRTGGLAVFVCGPSEMLGEMRNAVARVPISKQAQIGGINFHSEQFST